MNNTMEEDKPVQSNYEYIVNADGETTGMIVSPKAFEAFEEYMIDEGMAQAARDSKDEVGIPWEQIKAELVAKGKLDA
jgi:hypothetical protein